MSAVDLLLLLVPGWPLLLAAAVALPALRSTVLRLLPSAALPALLAALLPLEGESLSLPWLLLGGGLGLDEVGRVFLLFSALLWSAGGLSLPRNHRLGFGVWFLLSMAGNFGVLLAQEIPGFFTAYALMSLASFGLLIHHRTRAARRAARVYLLFAVLGEMILLSALLMVSHNAGTLELEHVVDRTPQDLLLALLLLGFGIKAGVPLLHFYLPPAYAAAPLAAAVPMAGALLHLGLYGWLRFLPLGYEPLPAWSAVLVTLGTLAAFSGVAVGLLQTQAKALLAYSSIAQMGLMTIALGIGLGAPEHWPEIQTGLLLFALHHALAKGALFHGLGTTGAARLGLWLPALALAGLPLTSGALAKGTLKLQLALLPEAWTTLLGWALPLASIGTALLMARFLYLVLRTRTAEEPTSPLAWWALLAAGLLLPWVWPLPLERGLALWGGLWPVLCAAAPAWLIYRGLFRGPLSRLPELPAGDLLVLLESLWQAVPRPHATHHAHHREIEGLIRPGPIPEAIDAPEVFLRRWAVSAALILVALIAVFVFLFLA